jgi:DNA-directed RNA polymerase subunit RPC12/RpoP
MADMKFSCPQCGQHIGCDEAWVGQQIECPACHSSLLVPRIQCPPVAVPAPASAKGADKPAGARLAPGATRAARSTARGPAPMKRAVPRAPSGENSLLRYGVMVVVIAILAGAGYFYGLPLITGALKSEPGSPKAAQSGATMGGPMGEVSGAMDVSETLDAGSSSPKSHPVVSTNNARVPSRAAKLRP